jgi:DNA-binding response OmpR family regulator
MRVLLVEDNPRLAEMVAQGLGREGYVVDGRGTLAAAAEALDAAPYDLLLLDLGMPDGDGIDFLRAQRRSGLKAPVLVLTARGGLGDSVKGLDAGADDYVIKPFDMAELAARCRALLRRPGAPLGNVLTFGDLVLDSGAHAARVADRPLELTPRELAMLEILVRRAGAVVRREQIEHSLYSLDAQVSPNALDAVASRLRRKLASAGADVTLRTAHGVGYALTATGDAP